MLIAAHEWSLSHIAKHTAHQNSLSGLTPAAPSTGELASLYSRLAQGQPETALRAEAAGFLRQQLAKVAFQPRELPKFPDDLKAWMQGLAQRATSQYSAYLEQRKSGGPRHYFTNRAHALYFLRSVAPTKLVDGAWLYGLIKHWRNPRFEGLIRTYVEELGEGDPDKNHVLLYRRLLARYDLNLGEKLADEFYAQGLVQLALAYNAEEFLPELIGFNLGYEQLPLHLLITAYELNELGLDPYYFTLHLTVDNADTGHARRAVQAALDTLPRLGDTQDFWRRMQLGCQLGGVGIGTTDVINGFDIEQEVVRIFSRKSGAGHGAHSDYCRVAGRSVNDWLAQPDQIPAFLDALQQTGWIQRGAAAHQSRFWGYLQGRSAEMFGVFSSYELQLVHDWIRGPASRDGQVYSEPSLPEGRTRRASFRAAEKLALVKTPRLQNGLQGIETLDPDLQALNLQLSELDESGQEKLLLNALSPSLHWTPMGLQATRLFCQRVW